jgi:hypothetical protein
LFAIDFPASLLALVLSRTGLGDAASLAVIGAIWWFCLVGGITRHMRKSRGMTPQ